MPLLRYRTGDVVESVADGYRLLGRERDLVFSSSGRLVTVPVIDAAIPADFECWHYCLTQVTEQRWNFEYVADHVAPDNLGAMLVSALGGETRVNIYRRRLIRPSASGKFALLKSAIRG